jgi:hypothetical protein
VSTLTTPQEIPCSKDDQNAAADWFYQLPEVKDAEGDSFTYTYDAGVLNDILIFTLETMKLTIDMTNTDTPSTLSIHISVQAVIEFTDVQGAY